MKLICNGMDLSDSFNKVIKAISSKISMPILEGVKLSAYGNTLTLTATDTDFTIEKKINADIMIEGEIVVNGKFTADLVRAMNGQQIELECIDGKQLIFKYVDSTTNIKCMNISEYPPIIDVKGDIDINMPKKEFKDLINKTIFSASSDEVKPILRGCLLKLSKDTVKCVALDGFRLAIAVKSIDKEYEEEIVVPAKALFEIAKLIDDGDENVSINISKKRIIVDLEHTRIISSLIEGEYLHYEAIIPTQFNSTATVIKAQLAEVLSRAAIIARRNKSNLLTLDFKENVLVISASSDIGEIVEKVGISYTGKDIKLGINVKYLTDCIDAINEEYIKISLTTSVDPLVITPVDNDNYLCLILPIRIIN